jgi:undecaprenyl-phosphate glucose phosphotransferase
MDRWQLMNESLELAAGNETCPDEKSERNRVILVASREDARTLFRQLRCESSGRKAVVVGFVDAGHRGGTRPRLRLPSHRRIVEPSGESAMVLEPIDRLGELVHRTRATHVVVATSPGRNQAAHPALDRCARTGVVVHWVSVDERPLDLGLLEVLPGPIKRHAPGLPLPGRSAAQRRFLARAAKRGLDAVLAAVGLLVLFPLLVGVAVAILVTSGRPIFYTQERVGQGGRRFRIIKFRSMRPDAERETGPIWATDHDRRCTRIGEWLRHTNIDELPQLLNVLRGDMSLVGPRPERPVFVEQFRRQIPDYDRRHAVPCGMTGWAQVHGWRGRTSLEMRIRYDLDYIERWSLGLDLLILVMTVQHVLWGKTSWTMTRPLKPEGM